MNNNNFYKSFEDNFRGSRKLIKERLLTYFPLVFQFKMIYSDITALDLGCGRGEWLELLTNNDIKARGIDLDDGMIKVCKNLNLNIQKDNAIDYLKEQKDESFVIVSAFHLVEHISFEDLQTLVQEALRVLKPGGLLIMETPNPENIKVSTEYFYLDPTHIKPIPSQLLSFLSEHYGFYRSKILRLQEHKKLLNQEKISLYDVISGVSPDYAIVAQKEAPKEVLHNFDDFFNKDYGLSLIRLSNKFENRLSEMESKIYQLEQKISLVEANYNALLDSKSWKITKPLRIGAKWFRWFKTGVKHWITFSPTSRPRRVMLSILNKIPKFQKILIVSEETLTKPKKLSSNAIKIYDDIKNTIEKKKRSK